MSETNLSMDELGELKKSIREQAHANRKAQPEKDTISRKIIERFIGLPEYEAASTVMFYVDVRAEVRTRHDLCLECYTQEVSEFLEISRI